MDWQREEQERLQREQELARIASDHYEAAQVALRRGDWATYGRELDQMEAALQALVEALHGARFTHIFALDALFFVPESPRWLIMHHRDDEAVVGPVVDPADHVRDDEPDEADGAGHRDGDADDRSSADRRTTGRHGREQEEADQKWHRPPSRVACPDR